ncbi:MAG: carotenoid oxygenase family protein [Rhodopila sp.]|jgi:carotenoid cleavage dioxygenase-like enzyme
MIHDCAVTRSHVVILDLPVTFSMGGLLRGRTFPYVWNDRHPARVGLLPRAGVPMTCVGSTSNRAMSFMPPMPMILIDVAKPGPQPLYRHDMVTGTVIRHDYGSHHMPAEAVFVPRHPAAAEDDGWLIAFVHDLSDDSSTLVVLDAGNLDGEPAATIRLPARVPLGFHGNWIADAA